MCIFCEKKNVNTYIVKESLFARVICSRDPITENGHFLIIPKRHHEKLSSLRIWEMIDLLLMLIRVYMKVNTFHSGAKNLLINEGLVAGQTVKHLHWHVICREEGDDIENMHKKKPKKTIAAEQIATFRSLLD
ncbi:MAG: hypothetical protein ACD_5C00293G0003 [uncultured bacterium]|nr:MAG: hypothetical protein ACD_5C00293G0003 [uncultured bacterium]